MDDRPVIAIVGTTGVGKTLLSIELAKALGGEVINADSMQVYKGLDIATNKATPAERGNIPHHLLDFVNPSREYAVKDFMQDATEAISSIYSRSKIPIIVGGTNYYIQSLLFHNKTIPSTSLPPPSSSISSSSTPTPHPSLTSHPLTPKIAEALTLSDPRTRTADQVKQYAQTDEMWNLLKEVDPGMAEMWHPRADRKIRRSLEIFYTTGKTHSEWMAEQKAAAEGSKSELRYRTIVFWLYADPQVLYPRLDSRVDEMSKMGLFQELLDMRAKVLAGKVAGSAFNPTASSSIDEISEADHDDSKSDTSSTTSSPDADPQYTRFKEFHPYFTLLSTKPTDPQLSLLQSQGVEEMKRATRQYARRQISWIKNKLAGEVLGEMEGGKAGFYLLDAGDLTKWNEEVRDKALGITQ
ncbi:hypothetical protein HK097_002158, partial [Rhizophlyctis rosea]